ncbi:8-amino-7-oxononanoate synthase [Pirellulimonas nuda]|uniref:8-amino-7-ketopelargonate synthase n=1 Tax=Pirellulimonas nuda TaxID=2528009 RepID=A0A518D6M9_9BACT|nr:8-amino-7-oxononanoate synthase [Pirellulimonas nuda]QDU87111.1 8-amino-7-oxononanoate synthase [Pirellulimonas nuda]
MLHPSLRWVPDSLEALEGLGLRRVLVERQSPQGPVTELAGEPVANFGSNDYLGLAGDPRLASAAAEAATREGWGAGASPLVTGRSTSHARLETRLAEFESCEAALVFPSGFAAGAGVVPALVEAGDAVFSDAKNHASLIDGCRLSGAARRIYPHNDWQSLDAMLAEAAPLRRRLIVTDGLFSMDGDLAPLDRLAELADKHDAMLMVDEAHATGVLGPAGRGAVEHYDALQPGVAARAAVRVGTLSKALGSAGGFVVGDRLLIDWLANRVRPYVFSTAGPPAAAAAALVALDVVRDEPHRRRELLSRAAELRDRLRGQGWRLGASESQIIPLLIGDPEPAVRLARRLREAGLWVPAIRPPTVPQGQSLLRISLSWRHTPEQLDLLTQALAAHVASTGCAG